MHVFLASLLGTVLSLSGLFTAPHPSVAQAQTVQKDYENHPNRAAIEYVVKHKLMWLFPDGNFRPEQPITQADLVAGLVNVKGLTQGVSVPGFPQNHWAKVYYERAMKDGILDDVSINPNKVLNREEGAFLIINAWESVRNSRTQKTTGFYEQSSNVKYAVDSAWLPKKAGKFPNGVATSIYDSETSVTRSEQAFVLATLHKDFVGIKEAEIIANKIHSSLRLSNGILRGTIFTSNKYNVSLFILHKNGNFNEYNSPGAFSVNVSQAKAMQLTIKYRGEAVPLVFYMYTKLPVSLEYENVRR
ncbi:S-layer homology domain-containing protein [Brevibacillus sedimenti]|uniref:S-layer homology domain-containing protein n=1 Tax=Brevibacillus sedimenti TaxID=2613334 RepID=UPI001E62D1B3|nr:S-layer homology domain-containing protein [Anoxybacillus sediminis]